MKRSIVWAAALWVPMILFTSGLAAGCPRPEYSPSTEQAAWLNGSTVYHPDAFAYVGIPYRMLLNRTWNPHYFHNPSLNLYSNMALFWLSGADNMPHNIEYGDREIAPFPLYVMANYLSALYSLLTVVLTYAAGRVAFNRRAGRLAAALVGLSPLIVQHAHYATPNAETTMLATTSLLLAFVILKEHHSPRVPLWLVYATGGLLVGLTMSTRYNAAVVGLVTGLAMLTAWWQHRRWQPVVVGGIMMPLGFALGTPGIVLATSEVIDQIREILDMYRQLGGGGGFTTGRGLSGVYLHWRYVALIAVGPAAVVAALVGLWQAYRGWRLFARWQDAWIGTVLVLYMLVYTILALPGKRLQANLLFPLIGPLALLAGYGVSWLWERRERERWIGAGLAVAVLIWPALLSGLFAYRVATPDNRMRAQEWIYEHVPRGSSIYLLGPYNVPLDPLDYNTWQTYKSVATPRSVQRQQARAQIIVYSDSAPFVILRDPSLTDDPQLVANEEGIRDVLQNEWIELKRFERMPWPGDDLPPDDVGYFHQMEIVIYCNPADCPVEF